MTGTAFESRLEAALEELAASISPRSSVGDVLRPLAAPIGAGPRSRRRLIVAAALVIIVGAVAFVMFRANPGGVETVPPVGVQDEAGFPFTEPSTGQGALASFAGDLAIWMDPTAADADRSTIEAELATIELVASWQYYDRDEVYAEFVELFADTPEMLAVVTADVLPARLDLTVVEGTSRDLVDELASRFVGRPGVRDVIVRLDYGQ
jgi:FtsX-like permease family protein